MVHMVASTNAKAIPNSTKRVINIALARGYSKYYKMSKYITIIFSVCAFLANVLSVQAQEVDATTFEKGIREEKVQILDVRTPGEFSSGHLHHALQADYTNQPVFKERVAYIDKQQPVYIYCLSGGRSAAAAEWMRKEGFRSVIELEGGINAWKKAGKPLDDVTAIPEMSVDAFNTAIQSGEVLVDVGAEWCPPCRKMEPVLQQYLRKHKQVKLLRVDGGRDQQVMQAIHAATLPTFILYKNGKEVWRKGVGNL